MSSSERFSGGRRSNFTKTCNLLSQFVKEKGSLRDLNFEIGGKVESLEEIVKSGSSARLATSMDSSIAMVEDGSNKASARKEGAKTEATAQLTIFYAGRVLVFDDYPAEKVRRLVSVAKKDSSQTSYGVLSNTFQEKTNEVASASREGLPPRPQGFGSKQHFGLSSNLVELEIR